MFTTSTRRSPVLPFDTLRHGLNTTRENATAIARRLAQVRRTALAGVTEVSGTVTEHGRLAIGDAVDLLRKSLQARNLADLVALQAAYAGRRGLATFKVIGALNAVGRSHALAIWTPVSKGIDELARHPQAAVARPSEPASPSTGASASKTSGKAPARAARNRNAAPRVASKATAKAAVAVTKKRRR